MAFPDLTAVRLLREVRECQAAPNRDPGSARKRAPVFVDELPLWFSALVSSAQASPSRIAFVEQMGVSLSVS